MSYCDYCDRRDVATSTYAKLASYEPKYSGRLGFHILKGDVCICYTCQSMREDMVDVLDICFGLALDWWSTH